MIHIHPTVVFYGRERIKIAPTARIDAFCQISAGPEGVEIGEFVHLSAGAKIFGGGGKVFIGNFCGISADAVIYTASDDFADCGIIGPLVPEQFRRVRRGAVVLGRHAAVGCKSVVMPGVTFGFGAVAGAMSLVRRDVPDFAIAAGIPAKVVGERDRKGILASEAAFWSHQEMEGIVH